MSITIVGGLVLRDPNAGLVRSDILVERDRIVAVEANLPQRDGPVIDAADKLVIPGLINAHTHSHNNLARGLADNATLEDALNRSMANWSNRTPEEQYVSAAVGAIEMVKTGCTAAYDLFTAIPAPTAESMEAVIRAFTDVGLRLTIAPALSDIVFYRTVPNLMEFLPAPLASVVNRMQAAPTARLLEVARSAVERWHEAFGGLVRVAVAPSIPGQCTDEFLAGLQRIDQEYEVGFHTHLLETKVQAIYAARRWGCSVVEKLLQIGALGTRFVGAHGVWLSEDDIELMASSGSSVVHNPAANLRLGSGIAPIRELLDSGVNVALGSDGSASACNQSMFEALRFAAMVGNVRFPHATSNWVGAQETWQMGTTSGARAMRLEGEIGAIAPGMLADLTLLDAGSPFLTPLLEPVNALVYSETGAGVHTVIVGGKIVLDAGVVVNVDEARIRERAASLASEVIRRNAAAHHLARELAPYVQTACRACAIAPYPIDRYAAGDTLGGNGNTSNPLPSVRRRRDALAQRVLKDTAESDGEREIAGGAHFLPSDE